MDAETKYNVASCLVVTSIIACTLSLIAIFMAYPIKSCYRPDANSVTVTILSILVTLLIGWNIVFSINSKSKIKNDIKRYVDETIKDTKEDMTRHFITEETTLCKSYSETKDWDKVLPLFNNMANRYKTLAKQKNGDDVFGVSSFVSSVAWAIDEIYKDKDNFKKLRSQIAGFMETFKQLWKYDERILQIYNETQDKIRKTKH